MIEIQILQILSVTVSEYHLKKILLKKKIPFLEALASHHFDLRSDR